MNVLADGGERKRDCCGGSVAIGSVLIVDRTRCNN